MRNSQLICARLSLTVMCALAAAGCVPLPKLAGAPAYSPLPAEAPRFESAPPQIEHQGDAVPVEVPAPAVDTAVLVTEPTSVDAAPVGKSPTTLKPPVWDLEVLPYQSVPRVQDFVRVFTGRAKEHFEQALKRQTHYAPMIRERLRSAGLPEDLTYLALVESWFDPHAYSRTAAVGVWQFMPQTGRGMGLRIDWWVDERRDPVRSTEAAARLLKGYRAQYGSMYLAAAAYNGGSGRVSRGLARYANALKGVEGEDKFFTLASKQYLRRETQDYVPKLIAAALIGNDPVRYNVRIDSLPPFAYDSVRVAGGTPLAAVAAAQAIMHDEIADLNPHVLRGMTAPNDSSWVRLPAGRAEGFTTRYDSLALDARRALTPVKSKKGETLLAIAKANGITSKQLAWYNPNVAKLKNGALRPGQTVLVPSRAVVALALDLPSASVVTRTKGARAKRAGGG